MPKQAIKILSVDIGTSAMKAALLDGQGCALWSGHEALPAGGSAHHDWDATWWTRALAALAGGWRGSGLAADGLSAVVVSGHGPSMVVLDASGALLGPAMLWLDGRQEALPGTRSYYLPKLAWWRSRHPEAWERAARVMSVPEWLVFRLGGDPATVSPHDAFSAFVWTPGEIAGYGFDPALFPPITPPGAPLGRVGAAAAAEFGLLAGTPLFAGGSDFMMSLAGTGTVKAGLTCDRAGSSEGLNHCGAQPVAAGGLRVLPHLVGGLWNIAGILPSSGLMFEWFRHLTGTDRLGYHETLLEVGRLPIAGDLPFFRPNAVAPATWDFGEASFTGLKPDHEAIHLVRAVVESIAFSVRSRLEIMRDSGCAIGEIRLCGGQAKNAPWVQMKADITGHELLVPRVKDAELLGNAMYAMIGLGHHAGLDEAVASMLQVEARVPPDPERHRQWTGRYQEYLSKF
jgi:xylulokinase